MWKDHHGRRERISKEGSFLSSWGKLWCALTRRDDNTSLCHTTEDNTRFLCSSRPLSTEPLPSKKKRRLVCPQTKDPKIEKHCIKYKRATYIAHTIYLCQMCMDLQRLLYMTLLLRLFVRICSWSNLFSKFWTVLFGLLDYVFHKHFYRLLLLLCSTECYTMFHNIHNVIVFQCSCFTLDFSILLFDLFTYFLFI